MSIFIEIKQEETPFEIFKIIEDEEYQLVKQKVYAPEGQITVKRWIKKYRVEEEKAEESLKEKVQEIFNMSCYADEEVDWDDCEIGQVFSDNPYLIRLTIGQVTDEDVEGNQTWTNEVYEISLKDGIIEWI